MIHSSNFTIHFLNCITLYVDGRAAPSMPTVDQTVDSPVGETALLRCSFTVTPSGAQVMWGKDGAEIVTLSECSSTSIGSCKVDFLNPEKHELSGDLEVGLNLQIRDIAVEDGGTYECNVIATEGFLKSVFFLNVTSE